MFNQAPFLTPTPSSEIPVGGHSVLATLPAPSFFPMLCMPEKQLPPPTDGSSLCDGKQPLGSSSPALLETECNAAPTGRQNRCVTWDCDVGLSHFPFKSPAPTSKN
mmetsp:Transcript_29904/g.48872  ORF Transcript_29904/g.48872 Transcript_29904/m.48872 type:complete len:106 (+) Transcript_29904:258-575(+)